MEVRSVESLTHTNALLASIDTLAQQQVLVLGDVMLDVYIEGEAKRISPEAPVPVVNLIQERNLLGGAGNVARNIAALGGKPVLLGLCGCEHEADQLDADVQRCGFKAHLLRSPQRMTTVKTRIMAQGQQLLRLDRERHQEPEHAELEMLLTALAQELQQSAVLVLSDYAKGLLSPTLWQRLTVLLASMKQQPLVLVDPKPYNIACYHNVDLLTPNRKELAFMTHRPVETRENLLEAGTALLQETQSRELLVTLAGEGMALFTATGAVWHIPTMARAVFDVTGAGDTVIAVLAQGLAAGLPLLQACVLANYAAGEVVRHVGVVAVDAQCLRQAVQEHPAPILARWR